MRNTLLTALCLIFLFHDVNGEKSSLARAQVFYESGDYVSAEKEILKAAKPPYSSEEEYVKTMNYFILIKAELYCSEETLSSNLNELTDIGKAYSNSKQYDKTSIYIDSLTVRVNAIGETLLKIANQKRIDQDYENYLTMMDHYVLLMEKAGTNYINELTLMAESCIHINQHSRALDYWQKVLDSGYQTDQCYKTMLYFLYSEKRYDSVDSLLLLAKEALPANNTALAEIEVRRLIDRDLMFRARTVADQAIESDPSNIEVIYLLGLIKKNLRNLEGAIDALVEVTNKSTTHFDARLELGRCFWSAKDEDGNLSLAKNYLEQAEKLKPDSQEVMDLLKKIYIEMGDEENFSRIISKK